LGEKKLPILISILPIASILLTVSIFLYSYNVQQKKIVSYTSEYIKNSTEQYVINKERGEIDSAFDVLINDCTHLDDKLKNKLKIRVDMVYDIMMNIYKNHKDLPKYKMVKIIKDTIREIRYNEDKGYFFIYSMDGVNILLPPDSSAEGRNFINFKDAHGNYPIREAIKIAKKTKKGYLEWYWYKPHQTKYNIYKSKMCRKIGYIRYFEPLNWFIGTGFYIDEEMMLEKRNFVKMYAKNKKLHGEYFVALEMQKNNKAKVITSTSNILSKGAVVDDKFLLKQKIRYMAEIFKNISDGRCLGFIRPLDFGFSNSSNKIYYYRLYKDINLLVVSSIELGNIRNIVVNTKKQYMDKFKNYTQEMIVISFLIVIIVGSMFIAVSKVVNNVFYNYRSQVKETEEKLKNIASHDELTKVYNRRKFDEVLGYEINMSRRYKEPLSLIMFDLDHFKNVNDTYGHDIGDKVLRIIARTVRMAIRSTDTLARWGGEEFFIILPKTNKSEAVKIAEHLRQRIENIKFGSINTITCSFGVAEFMVGETKDSFIQRADEAMYKAKTNGRNRVESL
jgi:diguanylate cyclase (GGDEF)-like protein